MENILYLHHGNGRPSFYVRVDKSPAGVKAIHGKLQFSRGFLAIVRPVLRTSGYSTQWLRAAGYEEVCSLGEDEEVLSCFYKGRPMPDAICKAIVAWWSKRRWQKAEAQEEEFVEYPIPDQPHSNPWEW